MTCGVGPTLSTITAAEDPVQALVVHMWLRWQWNLDLGTQKKTKRNL